MPTTAPMAFLSNPVSPLDISLSLSLFLFFSTSTTYETHEESVSLL